jgi:hypothetical protein
MRTLKRFTIDDLERTMVCIREEELRNYLGGTDVCSIAKDRSGYSLEQKQAIIDMLCEELGLNSYAVIVKPALSSQNI